MKKSKVEMITLAEMARLAGVSKPAATAFIHRQEESGAALVTISGRRTKTVDRNNPVVSAYIQNKTRQPSNRSGGAPPTGAALAKMKAQTEKTELSADVLRERYVNREFALQYLDKLLETEKRELEAMVSRMLKRVAEEFSSGGPADSAKIGKIRRTLEGPCNDALELCRIEIEKFRRDTAPRNSAGEPAAPPKSKHGKNNSLPRK